MNYYKLKNIKYKNNTLIVIFFGIVGILLFLLIFLQSYDNFVTYASFNGENFIIPVKLENSDIISKANILKIDDKMMMYQTETIRKDATGWKIWRFLTASNQSKRPCTENIKARKNRLNSMFKRFSCGRGSRTRTHGTRFWSGFMIAQTRIKIGIFKPLIANGTQDCAPFDAIMMI